MSGREPRKEILPFAQPDVGEAEIAALADVIRSGWLTTGPRARLFESRFAERVGAAHAVSVNSGTAALHLALEACGVRAGDEVIVPTYTFTATAEAVTYLGAKPVLADVDPSTLALDPAEVERLVTSRTRAIIGVDIGGIPCDWPQLRDIASARRLVLVDDAAHALPSFLRDKPIGAWADLTAFSFYATKTITTGEGGMLVTDNAEWATRAASMALHGISHDAWRRYEGVGNWYYEVLAAGFKYNMTDLAAALGLVQLGRLDEMMAKREAIAQRYNEAFNSIPEISVPVVPAGTRTSWHLYLLRLNLDMLTVNRAEFIDRLGARNVGSSVHFIPLHLQPYWRQSLTSQELRFHVAETEYQRVISLPIYSRMTISDTDDVVSAITDLVIELRR